MNCLYNDEGKKKEEKRKRERIKENMVYLIQC